MTNKIIVYEEYNVDTSIDVLEQKKLGKQGKRPFGVVTAVFDEAIDKSIYYRIESITVFDTVQITVLDKLQRVNYCIYRINNNNKLIYDPVSSTKCVLDEGKIISIKFCNEKEEIEYDFFDGEKYEGKI